MNGARPVRLELSQVRKDAEGKWGNILPACGIDRQYLSKRPGPCPICQEGKDRYRFDDKGHGRWYCSGGGMDHHGDGFDLLKAVKGWSFQETLQEVARLAGSALPTKVRLGPDPAVVRAEVKSILKLARPLEEVPAVRAYWLARVGMVPAHPHDLVAREALRHPSSEHYAASLAIIRKADGSGASLQRVFLTREGDKAPVPEPRMVMAGLDLPEGIAVRLGEPADGVLGIAEGVETAVAATVMTGVPCWAAINAVRLATWRPPEGVRRVIVFGDNDPAYAGQKAAYALGNTLSVGKNRIEAEVRIPDATGDDWNDVLLRTLARRQAA